MKLIYDCSVTSLRRRLSGPALSLDFANGVYTASGISKTFEEVVSFTRGSLGSYVTEAGLVGTAAIDEPRFDHVPVGGSNRGLLIEDDATNILHHSQDFSQTTWLKSAVTVSGGHLAPDGSATAFLMVPTATNAIHRISQNWPTVSGQKYTQSVWLKSSGSRYVYVNVDSNMRAKMTVDLQTGDYTIAAVSTENPLVVAYPNGWWRVSVTGTGTGQTGNNTWFQVNDVLIASDRSFTGNGTNGVLVWGAQLEEGQENTSYLQSMASAAPRAADGPGILSVNGIYDVTLTYDDLSSEVLTQQSVSPGWWPVQTRPRLRSMELR